MSNTIDAFDSIGGVDAYERIGADPNYEPPFGTMVPGPDGLYQPSRDIARVRQIPSDDITFATYQLIDTSPGDGITPGDGRLVQICTRKPQGVASRVRITATASTGNANGRIYLLRSNSQIPLITVDASAKPVISDGFFLCTALGGSTFGVEFFTCADLFAICANTAPSVGAVLSVSTELYYA